jgi:hypothetical protein
MKQSCTLLLASIMIGACGLTTSAPPRGVHVPGFDASITQFELQQTVERYATSFVERVAQDLEPLMTLPEPELADNALRLYARYVSSLLEAASGQQPELNALDMLVFVVLTRASVERYWLPEVYGERMRPLLKSLQLSERELWTWAEGVMAKDKCAELRALIEGWLAQHPGHLRVEWVRFAEFATISAESDRSRSGSGILASMHAATRTADAALLLAERALFLAQRTPTLLRVHTRLGAREVLSDSTQKLAGMEGLLRQSETLLERADSLRPLTRDLLTLTKTFQATLAESRALTTEMKGMTTLVEPLLRARVGSHGEATTGLEQVVLSMQTLNQDARSTLLNVSQLVRDTRSLSAEGTERVSRLAWRLALYAVLVGLLWTIFFWGGFYITRRLSDPHRRELTRSGPP